MKRLSSSSSRPYMKEIHLLNLECLPNGQGTAQTLSRIRGPGKCLFFFNFFLHLEMRWEHDLSILPICQNCPLPHQLYAPLAPPLPAPLRWPLPYTCAYPSSSFPARSWCRAPWDSPSVYLLQIQPACQPKLPGALFTQKIP